ncbi:glycosyl hydrolase family protein [Nocardioides euryhalodurans]|uniref:Glycosyl hydrolase family protein n=1 Tax=Nocardioides euryhalodurans TaxID=2518370 RepID=A0A4P7GQM8_9ACTN|nr:glycosyl hydrolase family protein [Nocardioides euryhalodurans]
MVHRFDGPTLDTAVWHPHYLPAWSSREATRASYRLEGGVLILKVPREHPVWCPGDHEPPLRVSGLQSGSWSGPVGSTRGQQRFREGQLVQEEQPRFEGWLPTGGRVAVRARMSLSQRSMAALWMSGFEDDPDQLRCGEICVFEVFGNALVREPPSAEVGIGIKAFRDPALAQDFAAPRVGIDVTAFHTYAVEYDEQEAVFSVDGAVLRRCPRPPTYPVQLMLAVFDFPEWSTGDDDHLVPELVVESVTG